MRASRFRFQPDSATSVSGRVVHGEAVPDFSADLVVEQISQGLAAMDVEVVQNKVDRLGCRVLERQFEDHSGELESGAVRRGEGEVTASLRLHGAENVCGAPTLIFIVFSCLATRFGEGGGTHVGMQRNRLLIEA